MKISLIIVFMTVWHTDPTYGMYWEKRKELEVIRIATPSLPTSLDSTKLAYAEHFLIVQCMCQALVRINEAGQIVSYGATDWTFDNGGKTIQFRLSKDLKFSDGSEVSAADVANSLNRHFAPKSSSAIAGYLRKIVVSGSSPFRAIGENVLKLEIRHPYPPLMHLLAMPGFCIQKIIGQNVIGSGPLKVEKISPNELKFVKNPYYTGAVKLQEMSLSSIPDTAKMMNQLKNGEVDVALGYSIASLPELDDTQFKVTPSESLATVHLYFNTEQNPELTKLVRTRLKSILQPIASDNKSTFLDPFFNIFPPGVLPARYYSKKIDPPPTNHSEYKKRLRIRLLDSVFDDSFAAQMVKVLGEAGFSADVRRLDRADFLNAIKTGDFDLLGARYFLNYPDPDAALDPLDKASPIRLGRFDSAPFLKKLAGIRSIPDARERLEKYADIIEAFEAENLIIPLYRLKLPIIHRRSVNIPPTNFRYEAELWKIFWEK